MIRPTAWVWENRVQGELATKPLARSSLNTPIPTSPSANRRWQRADDPKAEASRGIVSPANEPDTSTQTREGLPVSESDDTGWNRSWHAPGHPLLKGSRE